MFSTLLELAGFSAIVAATAILGGLPAGLYAGGVCALLVGYAVDDGEAVTSLWRSLAPVRRLASGVRDRLSRKRAAKAG